MTDSMRANILLAAKDLIQQRGVNGVSFQEISDAVGIKKASLYHYFSSKEELICELIGHCQDLYGEAYNKIALGKDPGIEKLSKLARLFEDGLEGGKACFIGMVGAERESLALKPQRAIEKSIQQILAIIQEIFEQGKRDHTIRCNADPSHMALMFLAFLQGGQLSARARGGKKTFRQMTNAMLEMLKVQG
ncbi:MAG: TetR/AcrR family transcriptional regulator [Nitrospirota bacterium]|nr:TetR/AcrR family transcriptional regulator [Nitrospirota bacterium]